MRIYLAGPEVFLPNAVEVLHQKKVLCAAYGHIGVSPFDANVSPLDNTRTTGLKIARLNEELIGTCQIVIANITPFPGYSADVGTVYEIGYAKAQHRTVYAYSHWPGNHAERIAKGQYFGHVERVDGGFLRETYGNTMIDDFEFVENAMIDGGVISSGGQVIVCPHLDAVPHYVTSEMRCAMLTSLVGFEKCLQEIGKADFT